jgi:hypothetical protein
MILSTSILTNSNFTIAVPLKFAELPACIVNLIEGEGMDHLIEAVFEFQ